MRGKDPSGSTYVEYQASQAALKAQPAIRPVLVAILVFLEGGVLLSAFPHSCQRRRDVPPHHIMFVGLNRDRKGEEESAWGG